MRIAGLLLAVMSLSAAAQAQQTLTLEKQTGNAHLSPLGHYG